MNVTLRHRNVVAVLGPVWSEVVMVDMLGIYCPFGLYVANQSPLISSLGISSLDGSRIGESVKSSNVE
jgi:hypothetical protein